jgi:hypothetical protein
MKLLKTMKRKLKDEAGQALPMALIMLVLGGLLVVPTLSFMTTNLNANRIIEEKTGGIHAADAGIQDALWKLGNDVDPFPGGISSYDLAETLNGMTVTVEKVALVGDLYTLKATARLDGEDKAVITAQAVAGSDYSWLFDNAIVSENDIVISNHDIINGDILCGGEFDGDEDQVYSGTITEDADVELPSPQELIDYYMSTIDPVANNYTSSSIYIPSSYTKANPYMIPPIYYDGDKLTLTGNGYGKMSGTIYVTGEFYVAPGTTIDLNTHTIFSEYDSNCPDCDGGNAINFQPNCFIYGPGCIIAIGNINYQPNLGTGEQLVGVTDADTDQNVTVQDRFALYKFKATATDKLTSFQVKCYIADEAPEAHVKLAVYADASGAPGTLLGAADYADNITVISGWNPIRFPPTQINSGTWYWLAAISDYPVISKQTVSSTAISKYKSQTFSGFQFSTQNPPTVLSSPNTEQYMLRGFSDSQEFIFIMSVECGVNLQPHASFYGTIAGDTTVELGTWCTINLVGFDEGDLDFPSITGSGSGSGTGGNSPPILNYNIQ